MIQEENKKILLQELSAKVEYENKIFDIDYISSYQEIKLDDFTINYTIDISVGNTKKTKSNSKVVIEDSVRNLQRSNADYKFLVRRCHNRNYNENDLGSCKKSYVVDSFFDAVQQIKEIKELWGNEHNDKE